MLVPGLRNIIKNVPDYNEIILVWDDYVREKPINFEQVQEDIQHDLRVIKHTELYDWPDSIAQWGWIRQQLAKLLCFEYSKSQYTWICDGDVLVTDDPELFHNQTPCLRYDDTRLYTTELTYVPFMQQYFGIKTPFEKSFVGSTALFDNSICKEMWSYCSENYKKSLVACVEEFIFNNPNNTHPFSEFATYGNYCYTHHRDKFFLARHNWNYVPEKNNSKSPIQIMWNCS
jgi:hypothetical protein